MTDTPQVLLAHHLKKLRLPTFLSEHDKLAGQCAAEVKDHVQYLLRLCELELIEAADERRLQRLQKQLAAQDLLIIDESGFVLLFRTGAELLTLTDNGVRFTNRKQDRFAFEHIFDRVCADHQIEHRLSPLNPEWLVPSDGLMVESREAMVVPSVP